MLFFRFRFLLLQPGLEYLQIALSNARTLVHSDLPKIISIRFTAENRFKSTRPIRFESPAYI